MTTSLGGAQQSLRLMVKNSSSSAKIARGTIVTFSSYAASNPAATFLDGTQNKDYGSGTIRQNDIPYITVAAAGADSTTIGAQFRLGVAAADIPAGGFGEIVVYGLARVLASTANITALGDVFTSDANGTAIDAVTASHRNPVGIALEAMSASTLSWCFINCIAQSWNATTFLGKTY